MNIKWSYYLIIGIYVLLIILRVINYLNQVAYQKENARCHKVFSIKRDFFTTIACICFLVTVAINIAAGIGGKPFNLDSVWITLLVIGFTMINSFTFIYYSEGAQTISLLGYCLKPGDVQKVKVKTGKYKEALSITFNREIESYNYMKLFVFGQRKQDLTQLLLHFQESSKEQ